MQQKASSIQLSAFFVKKAAGRSLPGFLYVAGLSCKVLSAYA
jgi:hypothetical protein